MEYYCHRASGSNSRGHSIRRRRRNGRRRHDDSSLLSSSYWMIFLNILLVSKKSSSSSSSSIFHYYSPTPLAQIDAWVIGDVRTTTTIRRRGSELFRLGTRNGGKANRLGAFISSAARKRGSRSGIIAVAPLASSTSSSSLSSTSSRIIDAAASLTQESCQLLGVKSIGVDYGLVRTGIAVTVGYDPKPLTILQSSPPSFESDSSPSDKINSTTTSTNHDFVCDAIIRCAKSEQASRIIVGLPLHKNGTIAEQTNITMAFAQQLAIKVLEGLGPDVPVILWDERYTSKEARARAHSSDPTRYLYGELDADAACIILEHYYQSNGVGGSGNAHSIDLEDSVRENALEVFHINKELEEKRLDAALADRERKIRERKESIARGLEIERQEKESGETSTTKKKKKKKKKKRR